MGRRKAFVQEGPLPSQKFCLDLDRIFSDFMDDYNLESYTFPADLDNVQRKYIHKKSIQLGIKSKSRGKEPNRILTITKNICENDNTAFDTFISPTAVTLLDSVISQAPPASTLTPRLLNPKHDNVQRFGRLSFINDRQIVRHSFNPQLHGFRQELPIFKHREEILEAIGGNQIVLIAGETGSGKTTQVPQYILESATESHEKIFIVCTQPRRISAVSMAERVSSERAEAVGSTVGYQIKLESKLSPSTALTYCTTGVLLRTLMEPTHLHTVSHIIVDEIHERDKFSDFLMIQLRELLPKMPRLRVILMSATMDLGLFKHYFKNFNPLIFDVPGRNYPVDEWFLEDIIPRMGYENKEMAQFRAERIRSTREFQQTNKPAKVARTSQVPIVDAFVAEEMNEAILACMSADSDDNFAQLMQLILSDSIDVNYQDPTHGLTALMVACHHGRLDTVLQLLRLNADITPQCHANRVARDYAVNCVNVERCGDVMRMLDHHNEQYSAEAMAQDMENLQPRVKSDDLDERTVQEWIDDYFATVSDEHIDFLLVGSLISFIRSTFVPAEGSLSSPASPGGILIFLPGYDDIMACHDWIMDTVPGAPAIFECYMLHGSMPIRQQNSVFRPAAHGKQKLILATNIAETSVTIADVKYVIDCGRLKEKTYDSTSVTSTLSTTWISKACAKQRAGRVGRTKSGFCFHIFTKKRYDILDINRIPEILRVPLEEICLSTKMLAPSTISIENYLNLAIQAPSVISIRNAITSLQHLGALDANENMTILGRHLVQLSVDPHLGKMVIYASIFKCLDPVLTIVAVLAQKDPFSLPTSGIQKVDAQNRRKMFADETYSDHMIFLRVFQQYQTSHSHARFCQENFLNQSTMEAISSWRLRLLSQMRAAGFVRPAPKDDIQDLNNYSNCWPLVKMVIASGLYPNIIYSEMGKLRSRTEKKIVMHAQSCLKNSLYEKDIEKQNNLGQNWIIFEELAKVGRFCSVRFGTVITTLTIALIGGEEVKLNEDEVFEIDGWLRFQHPGFDLIAFRQLMTEMVNRKVVAPNHFQLSPHEDILLATLVNVLRDQDREMGLCEPLNVGQKPIIIQQHAEYRNFNNGYNPRGRGRPTQVNHSRGSSSNRRPHGPRQNNGYRQYENAESNNYYQNAQHQPPNCYNNHRYNNYQQQGYYQNYPRVQQIDGSSSYIHGNSRNYKPAHMQIGPQNGRYNGRYAQINYFYANNSPSTSDYNSALAPIKHVQHAPILHFAARKQPETSAEESTLNSTSTIPPVSFFKANLARNLPPFRSAAHIPSPRPTPFIIYEDPIALSNPDSNNNDLTNYPECLFPNHGRYFIIKPIEEQNIRIALLQRGWKFAAQTEKKIFPLFLRGCPIILIFTVRNTFEFYGVARLMGTNSGDTSVPCKIHWITENKLNYKSANAIVHHKIHIVEDGQELELSRAKRLCVRIHGNKYMRK